MDHRGNNALSHEKLEELSMGMFGKTFAHLSNGERRYLLAVGGHKAPEPAGM